MRAAPPASTGPCPSPAVSTTLSWAPKAAAAQIAETLEGAAGPDSSRAVREAAAASRATVSRVPGTGWDTAAQVVAAMRS